MPIGISIHVGVDYLDKKHYEISGRLPFCSNDAYAMQSIANRAGFESEALINVQAIAEDFIYLINRSATDLKAGDILLVTFSGHGSYLQDINGDENDGADETLLFYNRMVVDDELSLLWMRFKKGVRILFISDSCHSGTVTKDIAGLINDGITTHTSFKEALLKQTKSIYHKHKDVYDPILTPIPIPQKDFIAASVLLLSACQDTEVALGRSARGEKLSLFTAELSKVWNNGEFYGNYAAFHKLIAQRLQKKQKPNYYFIGRKNQQFENQKPFTI